MADGKPAIAGSSDPSFRGDPSCYNPEELLVASLSACHMLWYLGLCANGGVVVTRYVDRAEGMMMEGADGSGRFTRVVLRPDVTLAAGSDVARAEALHHEAHAKCFIANSVNFPVEHAPACASNRRLLPRDEGDVMLELRPGCECCDRDLPPDLSEARICTYECTFCAGCAEGVLGGVCPNCGGNLVRAADQARRDAGAASSLDPARGEAGGVRAGDVTAGVRAGRRPSAKPGRALRGTGRQRSSTAGSKAHSICSIVQCSGAVPPPDNLAPAPIT